ncbi:MAG: hypothetical protein L0228_15925 [Planctomycetes bacterium]|nr:hypothetical protein [Planctomycetota bacterium]
MTFTTIFWSILAFAVVVVVPIMLLWCMVDHLRGKGSERRGGSGISSGVGAAMQELDRLVARPSIEHQVEAEHQTRRHEDDAGGE